ncbi:MAG TPA: Mut7-C RNAse domain-containing protein [Burkholderiaceae bacterium]
MSARIRLHGALRAIAMPRWRGHSCVCRTDGTATIKHAVEALGVPHTEIWAVRVNGCPASIDQIVRDASEVEVLPWPPARETPDRAEGGGAEGGGAEAGGAEGGGHDDPPPSFLADAHLGALARDLRLLGFDTQLANDESDSALAEHARAQGRILLSRDRELLKHRRVLAGCLLLSDPRDEQLAQIDRRFGLGRAMRPFTRCLECNAVLRAAHRAQVAHRLPPAVSARQRAFTLCPGCGRVYWRGSHWEKLNARVEALRARFG